MRQYFAAWIYRLANWDIFVGKFINARILNDFYSIDKLWWVIDLIYLLTNIYMALLSYLRLRICRKFFYNVFSPCRVHSSQILWYLNINQLRVHLYIHFLKKCFLIMQCKSWDWMAFYSHGIKRFKKLTRSLRAYY